MPPALAQEALLLAQPASLCVGDPAEPNKIHLGCNTESSVESTIKVSGSPTSSATTSRRKGSKNRRSFLMRR
jgi:hypothetical protein